MSFLAFTNFNIVVSVLGGWIAFFGLFSYLVKERYYLSEACKWWLDSLVSLPETR